jgi:penicillin-binding protein 1A
VYFDKHATRLTLSEAAYLAGIIPAPELYQPDGSKGAATERRDRVLNTMRSEGYIDDAELNKASTAPLKFRTSSEMRIRHQRAAYFLEWLRKEYLYPRFGECLYTCGLKIHTTLDLEMQEKAEEAVATVLDDPTDPQAALVSLTPDGEVRAFIGGRDFTTVKKARGFNFATDGVRQAGSAFKPFTLLTAIEENISTRSYFTGESPKTIDDLECIGPDGVWEPENYGGSSYGSMDLEQATINSVNTVYAELITEVGPEKVAELVERFGFSAATEDGSIPPNCSLSLGTLDVSVLQMARAYAAIAARGSLEEVTPISHIEDETGRCLLGYDTPKKMHCEKRITTKTKQAIDPNTADVLTRTLEGVLDYGTAASAQIGRPAAGKTGTTQDNRDAWFAGYVPQLTTVVWMGYRVEKGADGRYATADDFTPLMGYCYDTQRCRPVEGIDVTGGSFPAAIWQLFMIAALEDVEIEEFVYPVDEPDIVLNPPPPPEKEKDKDKDKKDEEEDNSGPGNHRDSGND